MSLDEGRTWIRETALEDPKGARYSEKLQPGYPDMADLPETGSSSCFTARS